MALWRQVYQVITPTTLIISAVLIYFSGCPKNASAVRITGPSSFITDGSRKLTLTCDATDFYPTPKYSWGGLCASNNDTCTFTPNLDQDGGVVNCVGINPDSNNSALATYVLNMRYPPPQAPVITSDTNNTFLSSGDKVTCTVTGGKPSVKSVILTCTNPADRHDVINGTSSSIIINTSTTNEFPMHCFCSALWDPEPGLYSVSSNRSFLLDYKGTVRNFTVNDTTELTVREKDRPSVVFLCDTITRSSANLSLHKESNGAEVMEDVNDVVDGADSNRTVITSQLSDVRCEDTGTFVCRVDNGFLPPNSKTVYLNVTCSPRNSSITGSEGNPPELTDKGLDVNLVANPVPYTFRYIFTGNGIVERDEVGSKVEIQTVCARNSFKHHLVTCNIKPITVPEEYIGCYIVSISNGLGEYNLTLDINVSVAPAPPAEGINILLIAGSGAAGGVFIFICVVVIVCNRRRGKGAPPKHSAGTDERPDSYAESVMIRNSAYESASVLELSLGPFNATSHTESQGHYVTMGQPNKAPMTHGSARTPDYEDAGYAVAGFGLDARLAEQPHRQPTTVPIVSPAPENNVYAVVNKHRKQ